MPHRALPAKIERGVALAQHRPVPLGAGEGLEGDLAVLGQGESLDRLVQERIWHVALLMGGAGAGLGGTGLEAVVTFETDQAGYVAGFRIEKTTGVAELDRQIFPILHLAEPFPSGETFRVHIPFASPH